jgi:threonyl-tRNA synthetase
VVVASIVSDADPYVREVVEALQAAGLRAEADTRNEKINYKVREHSVGKVPVILALGMKEVENRSVSVRRLGAEHQVVLPLGEAITSLAQEARAPDLRG